MPYEIFREKKVQGYKARQLAAMTLYAIEVLMRDRIILAPLMIPGKSMPRYHNEIGEYEICYSEDYIKSLFENTDHSKVGLSIDHRNKKINNCRITSSFLKEGNFEDQLKKILPFLSSIDIDLAYKEFNDLPVGSWFQVLEFNTVEDLNIFLESGKTGLSVELNHTINVNGKNISLHEEYERLDSPNDKLPYSIHINGGSTWGWGPNEHGEAHLEVKYNPKGKVIDKIFLPSSNNWSKANMNEKIELLRSKNGKVDRKERKKLAEWLNSNNNLIRCHKSWNRNNKYNNRVLFIN